MKYLTASGESLLTASGEHDLTASEEQYLKALLKAKLAGVNPYSFPSLTLADILTQSPAIYLSNIPPDLQVDYFLQNRDRIRSHNDLPIKSSSEQPFNITRAIFYYRLDDAHQFQRYHDSSRWNITIFLALLVQNDKSFYLPKPPPKPQSRCARQDREDHDDFRLNRYQRDFVTFYLDAVLEHHNNPTEFKKRNRFIQLWKDSPYDMFKLPSFARNDMKREMKRLKAGFERELDERSTEYHHQVARFVNVLVPGRKDQGWQRDSNGLPVGIFDMEDGEVFQGGAVLDYGDDTSLDAAKAVGKSKYTSPVINAIAKVATIATTPSVKDIATTRKHESVQPAQPVQPVNYEDTVASSPSTVKEDPENKLLKALVSPYNPRDQEDGIEPDYAPQGREMMHAKSAIKAVQMTSAKEIMQMLIDRFE